MPKDRADGTTGSEWRRAVLLTCPAGPSPPSGGDVGVTYGGEDRLLPEAAVVKANPVASVEAEWRRPVPLTS